METSPIETERTAGMSPWVLITGASQGIGRGIAMRLHDEGYGIINLDRIPPEESLEREHHYEVDLLNELQARQVLANVCAKFSPSRLVNNVGAGRAAQVEEATSEDLGFAIALQLRTALLCVQAILPGMKRCRDGRIVNISSRAALGKVGRSIYGGAKGALNSMTRTWAMELGRYGVTVNAVAPGPISTEFGDRINPIESPATQRMLDEMPMGRLGKPEDVAHIVSCLLDTRAGFTTGQVIYVCGGLSAGFGPI